MVADALALTRWLSTFVDRDTEAAFQEDLRPRLAAQMRFLAFLPASYLAALPFDYRTFGNQPATWWLAALRCLVWTLVAISGVLARRGGRLWPAQLFLFSGVSLLLVTEAVECQLISHLHQLPARPQEIPFIVLFVLGIYMMTALPLGLALGAAVAGSLLFLAQLAVDQGPWGAVTGLTALYLLFAQGVGLAFRVSWNRIIRQDFALRTRLEHEVAERKAAEAESRRANESKSRFLAVMSHEIRTPLNGVLGGVQLLQASPLTAELRQPVEEIARNGDLLAHLLDDLLDLARLEAGRLPVVAVPFRLAEVLATVGAALRPRARAKGLDLRMEVAPGLPTALVGDALRLRQVLINLVENAVKFTERGEVVLSLQAGAAPDRPERARCTFAVRDTGPGLDAEAQARVFTPFEQGDMGTHRRYGGAGLGLAICRELVAAMGGGLRLESAPGEGCRFSFTLDLPHLEAVPGRPGAHPLDVLVVDDAEGNLIVAEGLLRLLGHRPRCAGGVNEALAALAEAPFDAVILDLHMADLDGVEALGRIRAHPDPQVAALPVILCSADIEGARIQVRSAPVQGFLPKPLRTEALASALASLSRHGGPARPLVALARATRLRRDLGEAVWAEGLKACGVSMEASLAELPDAGRAAQALHRLAGLAATYGLPELEARAREAEASLASGGALDTGELETCCRASLEGLRQAGFPVGFYATSIG